MCHAGPGSLVFFWRMLNHSSDGDLQTVRQIKKYKCPKPVLIVQIHGYFNINAVHLLQNTKNIFWVHIRVLWSSFSLHWKPNILLVNYDSWWQHQMSVRELRRDRLSGRFSKSRGLSTSVSFLSSPPPPRSFTYTIFRAVFDSRSSFFVACVASVSVRFPPLSFFGSCFISRAAKTENPVPPRFFTPKPNGNACYAGYPICCRTIVTYD